jgi:hypothetical protein
MLPELPLAMQTAYADLIEQLGVATLSEYRRGSTLPDHPISGH